MTLIEAMAAGKPVVSTQAGGAADLVQQGHSGVLVPPQDPQALAGGIRQVLALSAQDRIKMGAAGRASVYPKYDITTLVGNIEGLYQRLLTSKRIAAIPT